MFTLRALQRNKWASPPQRTFPVRYFWEYVNMMFNRPDSDRIKKLGPDRACAEWVLRNGGKVVWSDGKTLADYNSLPPETQKVKNIIEIDGTESSISHYGFSHLSGCTMLRKIILHKNKYIDDRAMKGLSNGKETLLHVQVSECMNVTDLGLKECKELNNLDTLVIFGLSGVENIEECKQYLQKLLPKCKILDSSGSQVGALSIEPSKLMEINQSRSQTAMARSIVGKVRKSRKGISLRTVVIIRNERKLAEASSSKIVSPGKNRKKRKDKIVTDNFDIGILRRKIHEFYTSKKGIPTVNKLLRLFKKSLDSQAVEKFSDNI